MALPDVAPEPAADAEKPWTPDYRCGIVGLADRAAFNELEDLLQLPEAGYFIESALITGQGAKASVQMRLTEGESLEFDELRQMANATFLKAELAVLGALPPLKAADALRAVALVRHAAKQQRTATDDDHAREWGTSYLQSANTRDVDMSDQATRWEAFSDLRALDQARDQGSGSSIVLVDVNGDRYIRTGYFYPWVRRQEPGISETRISQRMIRVGWLKRNSQGRVKATEPGFSGVLSWAFLIAPEDWSGYAVTAGSVTTRAREGSDLSRVEDVTGRNRVTALAAAAKNQKTDARLTSSMAYLNERPRG